MSLRAVDLFCGAGGLTLGASLAGLEVVGAVDNDRHALKTYGMNFPQIPQLHADIRSIEMRHVSRWGKIDVLLAGPPCQSFSTSNQKTRLHSNPLNDLLFEPVRFLKHLRPRLAVLENVTGLSTGSRRHFLHSLVRKLKKIGYNTSILTASGIHCKLPQNRSRLFILASSAPFPDFQFQPLQQPTVYDAIADLPVLKNGSSTDYRPYRSRPVSEYAANMRKQLTLCSGHLVTKNALEIVERFQYVPPGGNWKNIPKSLMKNYSNRERCHTGIYHRLEWKRPSIVIGNFRKNMLIHPSQSRGLSVREAARLQSFPDDYVFCGSIGKQQQQVGNAVPPQMASHMIEFALNQAF